MTGLPGLWMVSGALDNWSFPELNRTVVRRVPRMELLEEQYPDCFAPVAHRRIENPRVVDLVFRFIVHWETFTAILLCVGTVMLGLAAMSGSDGSLARCRGARLHRQLSGLSDWRPLFLLLFLPF